MRTRIGSFLLLGIIALSVHSALGANPVLIQIGSLSGTRGTNASIPISLAASTGTVVGVQVDLVFDTNRLQLGSLPAACSLSAALQATHTLQAGSPAAPSPGSGFQRLRLLLYPQAGASALVSSGQLASCTFLVKSTAPVGASKVKAQLQEVSDGAGLKIFSKGIDGTLTVQ